LIVLSIILFDSIWIERFFIETNYYQISHNCELLDTSFSFDEVVHLFQI